MNTTAPAAAPTTCHTCLGMAGFLHTRPAVRKNGVVIRGPVHAYICDNDHVTTASVK
ncbi:hypothetical protein [Nocardia altamirensis]|uniref:hypothetical protein n=1 Tax=Nocardia altamirensis TaxID=472158 RepID=UPI0014354AB5|nr:hypothetical protein [Nocardia altamirensis]